MKYAIIYEYNGTNHCTLYRDREAAMTGLNYYVRGTIYKNVYLAKIESKAGMEVKLEEVS